MDSTPFTCVHAEPSKHPTPRLRSPKLLPAPPLASTLCSASDPVASSIIQTFIIAPNKTVAMAAIQGTHAAAVAAMAPITDAQVCRGCTAC